MMKRHLSILLGIGLLLGLLVACGRGEPLLGNQAQIEGNGRLLCSQSCAERGQCGYNENQQEVVLGHSASPATQNHNQLFQTNQIVTVNFSEDRQVEPVIAGEPFTLRFYYITDGDGLQAGWVAGWCIATP
jgi:hypothetical protein